MLDFVIVTHLPSFYKVHLYNELAKRYKLHVIFLGSTSNIRTPDFICHDFSFDASFLFEGPFEDRKVLSTCQKLKALLKTLKYKKIIVGGWEHLEFWLCLWMSPRAKNILCLESGFESKIMGPRAWLKKIFLSRVGLILAAGQPQVKLTKHLHFSKPVLTTKGVGLFQHETSPQGTRAFKGRFLYVGRLSPEKNIEKLLEAFKQRPQYTLTLAGSGPLQVEAQDNIMPLGHVSHEKLAELYQQHDVFILPSLAEPWGLVVEEALYHGLPVIVSQKVGAKELIENYQVGRVFNPLSLKDMLKAMDAMSDCDTYQRCLANIRMDLISERQQNQVEAYGEALG